MQSEITHSQYESRSRSWKTKEGPSTETPIDVGIADIHGVLQLVEPVLEHPEPEQTPDQYHHHYQARAQHAYPRPTAHLFASSSLSLGGCGGFVLDLNWSGTGKFIADRKKERKKQELVKRARKTKCIILSKENALTLCPLSFSIIYNCLCSLIRKAINRELKGRRTK